MTRIRTLILAAALLVLAAPLAVAPLARAADEGPWFDLVNCAMCKHLTAEPGLLDHMQWDTYKIAGGMLEVTRVEPAYAEAYGRLMAQMEQTGQRLMAGEQMHLCNACQSYGALMMGGAQMEQVKTADGTITLLTASDPAVVARIHAHTERTQKEYAAWVAEQGQGAKP